MSHLDKNRELCARMMCEDPYNAPKWEMVRRWANKDCSRMLELEDGRYPFPEGWWEKFSEYECFEKRDMPVLKVVAGNLQVCGDERVTRREGESLLEFKLRELSEVWEEIIMGADYLMENGWRPGEPIDRHISCSPDFPENPEFPERPERREKPPPEPEPPPAKGGRPADPNREKYYKKMVRKMWNGVKNKRAFCDDFLSKYPDAAELFKEDAHNLSTQFGLWLKKYLKS